MRLRRILEALSRHPRSTTIHQDLGKARRCSLALRETHQPGPLLQALLRLRPELARAAQRVYDDWQPGEDDDYGGGGICQDVAQALWEVINQALPDVEGGTVSSQGMEEQHVWVLLCNDQEGYELDLPYWLYEQGGGYGWEKLPEVQFRPQDIVIGSLSPEHVRQALEYE